MQSLLLLLSGLNVVIPNDTDQDWSDVLVIINGSLVCKVPAITAGENATVDLSTCEGTQPSDGVQLIRIQAGDHVKVIEAAPEEEAESAEAEVEAPEASKELVGEYRISGGYAAARRLGIFNRTDFAWNGCTVTANGRFNYHMPYLAPGAYEGIMLFRFEDDDGDARIGHNDLQSLSHSVGQLLSRSTRRQECA